MKNEFEINELWFLLKDRMKVGSDGKSSSRKTGELRWFLFSLIIACCLGDAPSASASQILGKPRPSVASNSKTMVQAEGVTNVD
jgi:hypothetical protein